MTRTADNPENVTSRGKATEWSAGIFEWSAKKLTVGWPRDAPHWCGKISNRVNPEMDNYKIKYEKVYETFLRCLRDRILFT